MSAKLRPVKLDLDGSKISLNVVVEVVSVTRKLLLFI